MMETAKRLSWKNYVTLIFIWTVILTTIFIGDKKLMKKDAASKMLYIEWRTKNFYVLFLKI